MYQQSIPMVLLKSLMMNCPKLVQTDADCTLRRKTVKSTWPSFFCGKPVAIFLR